MINDFLMAIALTVLLIGVIIGGVVTFDLITGRWKRFIRKDKSQ